MNEKYCHWERRPKKKPDRDHPPWFTKEIEKGIKQRRQYNKLKRNAKSEEERELFETLYLEQKLAVQKLIKEAIKENDINRVTRIGHFTSIIQRKVISNKTSKRIFKEGMSWQSGMQQGNNWYSGTPPYTNYGQYGFATPPPAGPGPTGATAVTPGVTPAPPQQGWGTYPPIGNFAYTQNWAYGGYLGSVPPPTVPPPSNSSEEKKTQAVDVSKIQPPLPPGPPPDEPPKEEKKGEKEVKKETKSKVKKEDEKKVDNVPKPTVATQSSNATTNSPSVITATANIPFFMANQFSQPPPPPPPSNYYPVYPAPNWYSPPYQSQNYPQNNMPNSNISNQGQFSSSPIKFNIPPKNNYTNNPLTQNKSGTPNSGFNNQHSAGTNQNMYARGGTTSDDDDDKNALQNDDKMKKKDDCKTRSSWEKEENSFESSKNDFRPNSRNSPQGIKAFPPPAKLNRKSSKSGSRSSGQGLLGASDWPETLKSYVGKCFARCVTELDKDQVEICLKGKLTLAARNNTLWTKDWDNEPLISVHSVSASDKKQDENDTKNLNSPQKVGGDPSRGFTLVKRSRSRSRSMSPYRRKRDRRPPRLRNSPSEYPPKVRDPPPIYDTDFFSLDVKPQQGEWGQYHRGGARGGRGKKKGKGRGGNFQQSEENKGGFYSKAGAAMSLDPELGTDERLQKRAARFAGMAAQPKRGARGARGARGGARGGGPPARKKKLDLSFSVNNSFSVDEGDVDWTSIHVVGTSTTLVKQYLRLTSAPEPSSVRTLPTLRLALDHVKKDWLEKHDYRYACDQFKSIRQDLTVQGIRDDFTILVYETHCRVALEKGDHAEFNQCQTQLKDLYHQRGGDNVLEFTAYRLLYHIFTKSTLDITSMLASFTKAEKKDECIKFSLELRAAWSLSNYHRFFKLYQNAPKMAAYLIDWFVKREREKAIKIMIKSYRPGTISAEYVKSTLTLSDEDWTAFVEEYKIVFTDKTNKLIDCKQTVIASG